MLRLATAFLILTLSSGVSAQAFKCRTPSGKIEYSDTPCSSGARTEKIQSNEYISPERQRQAMDVHQRNTQQLQGMEAANEAYHQQLQRQQSAQMQADARTASRENARVQQEECARLATDKNMGRSQRAALAELCASPPPSRERFDDCKEQMARAGNPSQRAMIASNCTGDPEAGARVREASRPRSPPPDSEVESPRPLSIIKNCNGATCTDQTGQRYTTQAGKTVRSDGKRCYQQGNAMYCD